MYRVYLLPEWREFGIDYPTRSGGPVRRRSLPSSFPRCRYVVRPCAS